MLNVALNTFNPRLHVTEPQDEWKLWRTLTLRLGKKTNEFSPRCIDRHQTVERDCAVDTSDGTVISKGK